VILYGALGHRASRGAFPITRLSAGGGVVSLLQKRVTQHTIGGYHGCAKKREEDVLHYGRCRRVRAFTGCQLHEGELLRRDHHEGTAEEVQRHRQTLGHGVQKASRHDGVRQSHARAVQVLPRQERQGSQDSGRPSQAREARTQASALHRQHGSPQEEVFGSLEQQGTETQKGAASLGLETDRIEEAAMFQYDVAKAAHFTGHRKINGTYEGPAQHQLLEFLRNLVIQWTNSGITTWISGGAIGVDQIAMEAVLEAKASGVAARLIVARPFPSQDTKWPESTKARFRRLCGGADWVQDVSADPYSPSKMQIRNIWMVQSAATTIAVWDGSDGGTKNCVDFALRSSANRVLQINPLTLGHVWLRS